MPGTPIRLAILNNVVTTLQAISTTGGYWFTVPAGSVTLDVLNLVAMSSTQLPLYMVAMSQRGPRTFYPTKRMEEPIAIDITVAMDIPDTTDPTGKATTCERLIADIERALAQDITRGGQAITTRVLEPQQWFGIGNQARVLVVQPVDVITLRLYGTPDSR